MLLNLFNIIYVLVAIAMIALILLQRGSGAQAGSSFGGGASGTVFGARGATTFLSRSTAILAAVFFILSIAMAWYLGHARNAKPADDLGVVSGIESPASTAPATPKANGDVPAAPASAPPTTPAAGNADVPTASTAPAPPTGAPAVVPPAAIARPDVTSTTAPAKSAPAQSGKTDPNKH